VPVLDSLSARPISRQRRRPAASGGVHAVLVVVPAHNEEGLIGTCLDSLEVASGQVDAQVRVVVVLDDCTDDTAEIVAAHRSGPNLQLDIVRTKVRNVGAARHLGVLAGLRASAAAARGEGLWIASTDADSSVPVNWLTGQLSHAAAGARVVVGTVEVRDWSGHRPAAVQRYLTHYQAVAGHGHVHGANLGVHAEAYLAADGFPAHTSDEDVALVHRLTQRGEPTVWAADVPVVTSSRAVGRAPHGFAEFLSRLDTGEAGTEEGDGRESA
jgi:hypothetical protein